MSVPKKKLSNQVIEFLNGMDLMFKILEVLKKYKLDEDHYESLSDLVEDILDTPKRMATFPSDIQKATKLNAAQATTMAAELTGHWLLPLEAYVGDVSGFIRAWGGRPEEYPVNKIKKDSVTPEKFVHNILDALGEKVADEALARRLEYVLTMLVRDVRTAEDTVKVLTRSKKVGGVELDEGRAQKLVKTLLERAKITDIDRGPTEKAVAPAAKPQKRMTPPAKAAAPVKKFEATTVSEADAQEVKAISKKLPLTSKKVSVKEMVDQVVQGTGLNLTDQALQQRFAKIIDSRLREVRTALQTRTALEETVQKGGLGLKGRRLAETVATIEKIFDQINSKMASEKGKEKAAFLKKQQVEMARRKEEEAKRLDERYTKMTGKAARPKPVPVTPQLSPDSVPATNGTKPQVRDVAVTRRLVGPLEELQGIDPTAWRRLSQDPKEAALKVKDKIELLENESYAKRLAGVKAWQSSPISRLYFEITREALSTGKSVAEINLARQKAKQPFLSEAEMQAILELNNQLRF